MRDRAPIWLCCLCYEWAMLVAQVLRLSPGAPPPRVLVVDDVPSNRVLLTRLLVPTGFAVREAEDGLEALEICEAWKPQAVLMDLQMPRLNGRDATVRIKAAPWGVQLAVIVISGTTDEESIRGTLAAGACAFIRKPFIDSEILDALGAALGLQYA